jgi:hypothetical protein
MIVCEIPDEPVSKHAGCYACADPPKDEAPAAPPKEDETPWQLLKPPCSFEKPVETVMQEFLLDSNLRRAVEYEVAVELPPGI